MKYRLVMIFATILVSTCVPYQTSMVENKKDKCIEPLFDIAFPVGLRENDDMNKREVPPQGNWKIQDELPFQQNEFGYIYMRQESNELVFTGNFENIYIYSIKNKEWKSYSRSTSNYFFGGFFVARDGSIWAQSLRKANNLNPQEDYPLLAKLNDTAKRFEFVEDRLGILRGPSERLISRIVEDQTGQLWFLVQDNDQSILTSFDPLTLQSKQHHIDSFQNYTDVVIGLDDSLWLRDYGDEAIIKYIPSSGEVNIYHYPSSEALVKLPSNFDRANYIYMDRLGRLWIANYGWLEFLDDGSPQWYRVIQPSEFVTDQVFAGSQYMFGYQYSTYQSSDGSYWFTGGNGIVRLDMEHSEWCLMTTGRSNVVEDDEGNLWIAVFGHLYKYSLRH
jgi:hypothetical protein